MASHRLEASNRALVSAPGLVPDKRRYRTSEIEPKIRCPVTRLTRSWQSYRAGPCVEELFGVKYVDNSSIALR